MQGIEQKVATLPYGATVTVTASPKQGLDRTVDVSAVLAARGFTVIPHLAARMVAGRSHLERLLQRLDGAGIREVFVVGGDADPPAGDYADAGDLLEELAGLAHPFARIGIGGYPEGHPLISDEQLFEALRRKQRFASLVVTQLCFDAGALTDWAGRIRAAGIDLPIVVGLPGVVERRKLAEISLKSGVGASLSYLRKHGREIITLARTRRYDPTPLARSVAAYAGDQALGLTGAHLFTFNQVQPTRDWVARHV
ncbi:MAG TPA: methylenetetrahydrofolate reductase [Thermoleophilia bacterium]|nr:methylenetetrahydrofolate reductase [Thermoleophilia bacterium]